MADMPLCALEFLRRGHALTWHEHDMCLFLFCLLERSGNLQNGTKTQRRQDYTPSSRLSCARLRTRAREHTCASRTPVESRRTTHERLVVPSTMYKNQRTEERNMLAYTPIPKNANTTIKWCALTTKIK